MSLCVLIAVTLGNTTFTWIASAEVALSMRSMWFGTSTHEFLWKCVAAQSDFPSGAQNSLTAAGWLTHWKVGKRRRKMWLHCNLIWNIRNFAASAKTISSPSDQTFSMKIQFWKFHVNNHLIFENRHKQIWLNGFQLNANDDILC